MGTGTPHGHLPLIALPIAIQCTMYNYLRRTYRNRTCAAAVVPVTRSQNSRWSNRRGRKFASTALTGEDKNNTIRIVAQCTYHDKSRRGDVCGAARVIFNLRRLITIILYTHSAIMRYLYCRWYGREERTLARYCNVPTRPESTAVVLYLQQNIRYDHGGGWWGTWPQSKCTPLTL